MQQQETALVRVFTQYNVGDTIHFVDKAGWGFVLVVQEKNPPAEHAKKMARVAKR